MLRLRRTKKEKRRKTILIVDDNPTIRQTLRDRLEGCPWSVLTAADGQQALELALAHKPDLLLLDIYMPGMDGHRVLSHLRENAATADIKVIMVTASQDVSDITTAAAHNIQDYVTKPFFPTDVVSRIEQALNTEAS